MSVTLPMIDPHAREARPPTARFPVHRLFHGHHFAAATWRRSALRRWSPFRSAGKLLFALHKNMFGEYTGQGVSLHLQAGHQLSTFFSEK
jgi:hypothetical protein